MLQDQNNVQGQGPVVPPRDDSVASVSNSICPVPERNSERDSMKDLEAGLQDVDPELSQASPPVKLQEASASPTPKELSPAPEPVEAKPQKQRFHKKRKNPVPEIVIEKVPKVRDPPAAAKPQDGKKQVAPAPVRRIVINQGSSSGCSKVIISIVLGVLVTLGALYYAYANGYLTQDMIDSATRGVRKSKINESVTPKQAQRIDFTKEQLDILWDKEQLTLEDIKKDGLTVSQANRFKWTRSQLRSLRKESTNDSATKAKDEKVTESTRSKVVRWCLGISAVAGVCYGMYHFRDAICDKYNGVAEAWNLPTFKSSIPVEEAVAREVKAMDSKEYKSAADGWTGRSSAWYNKSKKATDAAAERAVKVAELGSHSPGKTQELNNSRFKEFGDKTGIKSLEDAQLSRTGRPLVSQKSTF